jgi:hypothetical protein
LTIFFSMLQVHSPSGAATLIASGMGPHFIFTEGDSEFRDHGTDTIRSHMRTHHTFGNSLDAVDDVLSSHKLQEPPPAGKQTQPQKNFKTNSPKP